MLISLLQQIGSHLAAPPAPAGPRGALAPHDANWPELQARWLSDCLLALEPNEPVISASVPSVLSAVEQSARRAARDARLARAHRSARHQRQCAGERSPRSPAPLRRAARLRSAHPRAAAWRSGLVASMALPAARESQRQLSIALHVVRSLQR